MCYHTKLTADKKSIQEEFDAEFFDPETVPTQRSNQRFFV